MPGRSGGVATIARSLLLALILTAPAALAHGEDDPATPRPGPGHAHDLPPWFSTFDGYAWWGTLLPLHASNYPINDLHARGDWAAWSENGNIVALHLPTSQRVNVTNDVKTQTNPVVDGNRLVYEHWEGATTDLYLYDFDTGKTRRLTSGPGSEKDPDLRGRWLAWLDDRAGSRQVWGMNLDNGTEFPIAISSPRKSDVVLLEGGIVAWREIEHNQWDIAVRRLPDGEVKLLTRDRNLEYPPVTDGQQLFWVKLPPGGGSLALYVWDPATGTVRSRGTSGVTANPILFLPGGTELTYTPAGPGLYAYTALNRTINRQTIISEAFPGSGPVASGKTILLPARNNTHHVLLQARVSDFATHTAPEIRLSRPLDGGVIGPGLIAAGTYKHQPAWPNPIRFEYRVTSAEGSGQWTPFPVAENWTTRIEMGTLSDRTVLRLNVRAVYEAAPSAEESVRLTYRIFRSNSVDLDTGVDLSLATFVAKNPGMVLAVLLAVLVLALLLARWRLRRVPRQAARAEYVRPDE